MPNQLVHSMVSFGVSSAIVGNSADGVDLRSEVLELTEVTKTCEGWDVFLRPARDMVPALPSTDETRFEIHSHFLQHCDISLSLLQTANQNAKST